MRILLLLALVLGFRMASFSQDCTELGQNPGTAFPVCGVATFKQAEVKICGNKKVPSPCTEDDITDKNPYWYKFTCFSAGTLGFIITPEELSDDYDWQLFDITDHNPNDVYTDKSLFVACNWSGESGVTGASSAGTSLSVCAGPGKDLWSLMPQLIEGHEYLLLISHFTDTQSGYSIDFTGGTASITDTKIPALINAVGACNGNQVGIKLNKKMRCSSLAADGSDFNFPGGEAIITSAVSYSCSSGFDMDSIILNLDRILPEGTYSVAVKKGTDNNSLLDICNTEMGPAAIGFIIPRDVSAAFNYTINEGCKNDTVQVSHDGANDVNSWRWDFGTSTSILQSTSVIYTTPGDKNITLIVSNDYCSDTVTNTISLTPKIKAAFDAPEIICSKDPAVFTNRSEGEIKYWKWDFGEGAPSPLQNPDPFKYPSPSGEKKYTVKLTVSDDKCADSASKIVIVVSNCSIAVPNAFTPNNDGKND
ncbi:MAG: PKD domain-containing protein, partial [Chitinophagaceae bacterium]|nr:PKD domain-containing protein [Chitinophagaceae bacterium]